ncbi:hypothetical protein AALT_g10092 [Alternaria alternata]|nr:hypothetical protein AALT_g10092 [Alternaria alternata]
MRPKLFPHPIALEGAGLAAEKGPLVGPQPASLDAADCTEFGSAILEASRNIHIAPFPAPGASRRQDATMTAAAERPARV